MTLKPKQLEFLAEAEAAGYPAGSVVGYPEIDSIIGEGTRPWWIINDKAYRAGRGKFTIPSADAPLPTVAPKPKAPKLKTPSAPIEAAATVTSINEAREGGAVKRAAGLLAGTAVPSKFKNYAKFGHFADVKRIIESRHFYPVFVTGLSGNGKTLMVEQACAETGRELFRVNFTIETDEDDLLGGFRLIDGETQWVDGPVIEAARRGAVLLLDEMDLGSPKIMCLQSILEGKEVLLKKVLDIVKPAPGFTIFATANTKGKGDEAGRFVGTTVMNEAMLERFPITMEQEYPPKPVETKILRGELKDIGADAEDAKEWSKLLVAWADGIRKTFLDGGIEEIITTRRLVHIVKAYGIFGDKEKAVASCIARFDDETKSSFMDLYKMHAAPEVEDAADEHSEEIAAEAAEENIPF